MSSRGASADLEHRVRIQCAADRRVDRFASLGRTVRQRARGFLHPSGSNYRKRCRLDRALPVRRGRISTTAQGCREDLDAWGFVMRAMPLIWTWAADDNETAVAWLKQATRIDPAYARANALLAWVFAQRLNIGWAPVQESRASALAFARLAVDQDPEDAWARLALGYIHSMSRRFEPAVEELTASLTLNPSFAFGHAMLGMAYGYAGGSDQGLHHVSLALRLSPRDPQQAPYLSAMGLCHFMAPLRKVEWVVYSKRPFGGPKAVLAYLSRYTHRVAISNSRLIAADGKGVTFKVKDYRIEGPGRYTTITLATGEFIRRFLTHVLPKGLHRIRHYGLFANGGRAENIARARQLLHVPKPQSNPTDADTIEEPPTPAHPCPCCGGRMIIIETFERRCSPRYRPAPPSPMLRIDTS